MFAAEGFISLSEIVEILADLATEWRLANPHRDDPEPNGIPSDVEFGYADPNWHRSAAYREWLLQCFLNRHEMNLFATTPNGRALKLSGTLVQRHHLYDGLFEDNPDGWRGMVEHTKDPFTFINKARYSIDLAQAEAFSHCEGMAEILPLVAKLDNYPVCWPLPKIGGRLDWLSICGVSKGIEKQSLDMSPAAVSKRILQAWSQNPKLTKSQIKVAIAPSLSVRQFGLAWSIAASENPKIAAPGRK